MLSTKPIPTSDRLIFALDVDTPEQAKGFVNQFGDTVNFYKLGLQLFMADGYHALLEWLVDKGKRAFVDLKFFDVPETVARAVSRLSGRGATFATVHGNDRILEAACAASGELKILAVTVLTSLDRGDLDDLGFDCDPEQLVLSRARRALAIGCEGVISSGLEAPRLRRELGEKFLVVSPGIRPVDNCAVRGDDQKRVTSVEQAFRNGADYIVVGRPIRSAADPLGKALEIQQKIATIFASASPGAVSC